MAESGKESELRKQERNKADEGHLKRKRNESENAPKITVIKLFTIFISQGCVGWNICSLLSHIFTLSRKM
jgi:hypothetical protein